MPPPDRPGRHRRPAPPSPPSSPRGRKSPAEAGRVWFYGLHPVLAAVANPARPVLRIVATAAGAPALTAASAAAAVARPTVETLAGRDLEALLPPSSVHQGVAALVGPLDPVDLADAAAAAGPDAILVVLDQVTDPRNVGAVLRAAAAFRAGAVIVQDRHAPEVSGALAKAAAGALEAVPLIRVTNLARTLRSLKDSDFTCVGLDGAAAASLAAAALSGRIALVLGSEGEGLRRLVGETCDLRLRIPIAAAMESLNIATAAAIGLYELRRGRLPG